MIYLLRHGEIQGTSEKRFIGQIDIPLNERGVEQAENWKKELSGLVIHKIYSSDLARCMDTARIIAGEQKAIHFSEKLREISLGEWEGLLREDVKKSYPTEWEKRGLDFSYRPPGGESFYDLKERVVPFFEEIAASNHRNIIIITHGGVIRVILCHILGMPLERLFSLSQDYSGMNLIDNTNKSFQLVTMNRII